MGRIAQTHSVMVLRLVLWVTWVIFPPSIRTNWQNKPFRLSYTRYVCFTMSLIQRFLTNFFPTVQQPDQSYRDLLRTVRWGYSHPKRICPLIVWIERFYDPSTIKLHNLVALTISWALLCLSTAASQLQRPGYKLEVCHLKAKTAFHNDAPRRIFIYFLNRQNDFYLCN